MQALATPTPRQSAHAAGRRAKLPDRSQHGAFPSPSGSHCSCGGGCPRCQAAAALGKAAASSVGERTMASQLGAGIGSAAIGVDGDWLAHKLSSGRPLDPGTRMRMEDVLGEDLSTVRIHADRDADIVARTLNAQAATIGQHVAFAEGAFDPGSESGRRLLLHELAHTVQQRDVRHIPSGRLPITRPAHSAEREASSIAAGVKGSSGSRSGPAISRATSPQVSLSMCGVAVEAVCWGATSALVAAVAVGCAGGSVVTFGGLAIPCTALVIGSAAVGAVDAVLWSNILKDELCGEHNIAQADSPPGGAGASGTAVA